MIVRVIMKPQRASVTAKKMLRMIAKEYAVVKGETTQRRKEVRADRGVYIALRDEDNVVGLTEVRADRQHEVIVGHVV